MNMTKIILKKGREESLLRFHPWVFSGAIAQIVGEPAEGDIVGVFASDGSFLAYGHYQIGSIAVRVLSFNGENPTKPDFFRNMLSKALRLRIAAGLASLGHPDQTNDSNPDLRTDSHPEQATHLHPEQATHRHPGLDSVPTKNPVPGSVTNCYRLVHGEGDGLPGLIIDFYDGVCVMQAHSVGMHLDRQIIAQALKAVMGDDILNIFYKSEATLPFKAELGQENGFLLGGDTDDVAMENGLKFHVDWLKGQKTGFFVDQRDNRSLLEQYSKGRKVLNMFCYTGGFSFYAMRGGAELVHSVDSSQKAIDLTKANVELNFPNDKRHEAYAEDAFKFMEKMQTPYDLIILDPPAFAKHKDALRNALKGYTRLNRKAFEKIQPGGILFTFSCSQAVNKDQFRSAVFTAAAQAGRNVRILHQLHQPADHPINIYHPEGEYLKGLVLYVE